MSGRVLGEVTIPAWCSGPPSSANGGYACGVAAAFVEGPAEATLRVPPPLETPLRAEGDGGSEVRLFDGDTLVAEAQPATAEFLDPPARPSFAQALEARSRHPKLGIEHEMSGCFVCGPEREDGLGVTPGPIEGADDVGAAPFSAGASVSDGGVVRPEMVWAALDCPSYVPSMWATDTVSVLGRMALEQHREVREGEDLVVVGWPVSEDGRKRLTASALLDAEGEVVARARATWIELA